MNSLFDISEIRKALKFLKGDNNLFEVRLIKSRYNASGYFTSVEKLISELNKINNEIKSTDKFFIIMPILRSFEPSFLTWNKLFRNVNISELIFADGLKAPVAGIVSIIDDEITPPPSGSVIILYPPFLG